MVFAAMVSLATGILVGLMPLVGVGRSNAAETLQEHSRDRARTPACEMRLSWRSSPSRSCPDGSRLDGRRVCGRSKCSVGPVSLAGNPGRAPVAATRPVCRQSSDRHVRKRNYGTGCAEDLAAQSAGFATYPLSGMDEPMVVYRRRPASAASRCLQHGAVSSGERLFRNTRHSADSRTMVHAGGYGGFAMGRRSAIQWRASSGLERTRSGSALRFGPPTAGYGVMLSATCSMTPSMRSKPEIYVPVPQAPNDEDSPMIVVRTALDPGAAAAELRAAVSAIDPAVPVDRSEQAAGVGIGGAAAFSAL